MLYFLLIAMSSRSIKVCLTLTTGTFQNGCNFPHLLHRNTVLLLPYCKKLSVKLSVYIYLLVLTLFLESERQKYLGHTSIFHFFFHFFFISWTIFDSFYLLNHGKRVFLFLELARAMFMLIWKRPQKISTKCCLEKTGMSSINVFSSLF